MWVEWEHKIEAAFPQAYPMPADTLAKLLHPSSRDRNKVIVLDSRSREEYAISRIHPNAIRVDETSAIEEIQDMVTHKFGTDDSLYVVFYCSVGFRSARLAQAWINTDHDIKRVYSLKGGIFNWGNDKRLLVRTDEYGDTVLATGVFPHNKRMGQMLEKHLHEYPPPPTTKKKNRLLPQGGVYVETCVIS